MREQQQGGESADAAAAAESPAAAAAPASGFPFAPAAEGGQEGRDSHGGDVRRRKAEEEKEEEKQRNDLLASPSKTRKSSPRVIVLFDMDGTLTPHRQPMEADMYEVLKELRRRREVHIAVVSGSDEGKMKEQLQLHAPDLFDLFDYIFCENGCVVYRQGSLLQQHNLAKELGEENLKKVVNFALRYVAELDIPIKRGTFVEYRHGMLNISPIGRNCSTSERRAFAAVDEEQHIRKRMQQVLTHEFADSLNLHFSLGGQISVDCFPKGWDKRLCLPFLKDYEKVHFFGDRTQPGGNDYEVFRDPRTIGHAVDGPAQTMQLLKQLFLH